MKYMRHVVVALVAFEIVAVFASCAKVDTGREAPPAVAPPKISADQLALKIDPCCKMSLEHHTVSDVYTYKDKQYGFCSGYCKDEFAKDPAKYLEKLKDPAPNAKE